MFGLLRFIFWTVVGGAFLYFALAVPLGKRTLAGHFLNVWSSSEGRELREGAREAAGPVIDKMKRGARDLLTDGGSAKPLDSPTKVPPRR
jgi:hypothetical protein